MHGTMRPSTTPRIDPNEHARRVQEAKARAAELKARRQADYPPAPAFQARPVPPTTYSASNPPPSNDGGTYQHYSSVQMSQSQQAPGAQRLPAVDVGPYGQQSYAQPASENRPAYRGMINYSNPPAGSGSDSFGRASAYENKAQDHGYAHPAAGYSSNGPVAPQPLAQNTYARNNAALAKEADDMFYLNLRSSSNAKGSVAKRPEWTSDFVSDPYAAGPAQQSAPSDSDRGASKVLSTKMKLAMMRDDLTGQTAASDPRISKEYAGIVPGQSGRGSSAARQGGAAGGSSYDSAQGSFGGASGSGFGGGSSYSGRASMGGAAAAASSSGGGTDSFADAFPARAGQVVSRTGLKPSGRKVQPANSGGGGGGMGASASSYTAPPPSSYGNDDMPVGGRAGGGASAGGDQGMGMGGQRGNGNDDMPVGGAARQAVSYGNDDMPIGGAAAKRASTGGGYALPSADDFGPDSLPPGATPSSTSGGPQRSAAAMRARAHAEKAKAAAAGAEGEDYTAPAASAPIRARPAAPASSMGAREEAGPGNAGGWSMDFGLDEKPRGSPPKLSSGTGRLDLLKSKMRSSSANSTRSAGGAEGGPGQQRGGGWGGQYGASGEDSGYDEEPGASWSSSRDAPARPVGAGGPGGRPPSGLHKGGHMMQQHSSSSYDSPGYDDRSAAARLSPAKGPAAGRGGLGMREAAGEAEVPDEEGGGDMHLLKCSTCGRKFNEKALEKHERICAKVFLEKRKAFDMKAHIIPEEAQALAASKAREERKGGKGGAKGKAAAAAQASADAEAAAKKTAWEAKSNQLREAMRAAREYKAAVASGIDPRDIPPPVMSSAPDPSLVPCPHCGRTFNEHSAERHIPKCQSTRARPTMLKRGAGVAAGAAGIKKMGAPIAGGDLSMSSAGSGHGGYQSYDDWPAGGSSSGAGMPSASASGVRASTAGGVGSGQRANVGGRSSMAAAAPKRGGGLGYSDLPDLPDAPASALYGGMGGGGGYGGRTGGGAVAGGRAAGGLANSRVGGYGGGADAWEDAPVGGGRASVARTSVGGAGGGSAHGMGGRASMGASAHGGGMAGAPVGSMAGRQPRGAGGSMSAGPTRQSMGGYGR